MQTVAALDLCEQAPLGAGHTNLSCQLDVGKPASNSHRCEPGPNVECRSTETL